jgi:AAA ATPase containing von Willebrand factor type A (vWA) domain
LLQGKEEEEEGDQDHPHVDHPSLKSDCHVTNMGEEWNREEYAGEEQRDGLFDNGHQDYNAKVEKEQIHDEEHEQLDVKDEEFYKRQDDIQDLRQSLSENMDMDQPDACGIDDQVSEDLDDAGNDDDEDDDYDFGDFAEMQVSEQDGTLRRKGSLQMQD